MRRVLLKPPLLQRYMARAVRTSVALAPLSVHRPYRAFSSSPHTLFARPSFHPTDLDTAEPLPAQKPIVNSPLGKYISLVDSGLLINDDHQRKIVRKLQNLHDRLESYYPKDIPDKVPQPSSRGGGFLSRLFSNSSPPSSEDVVDHESSMTIPEDAPKGIYLYGTVGTGKSMLMDLFHSTLPSQFHNFRRRIHFHQFMLECHKRNHAYKLQYGELGDKLGEVARDLAREARVLSFDEFQVTDITDAMILRNLLERLMGYGVVCVMTSNRHPDELYKNGLQRQSFLPCIQLIKDCFEIVDLNGNDYRRVPGALNKVYFDSSSPSDTAEFRKMFESQTSEDLVIPDRKIDVWGRKLVVKESSEKVAWFRFKDLCGKNLGAADYLEVTKQFGTIFLGGVEKMNLDTKDKARRFITFIDACYESRTKLYISSEAPIMQIFSSESESDSFYTDYQNGVMNQQDVSPDAITSPIFTGEEEVFAFKRCVSRLSEMGGQRWAHFSAPDANGDKAEV
ncbi:Predicted ATPase [Phaffia rhodozyma]|uniref:Predicted ATPase n=1 Tax=Phaffia rhodozyma TaxID=264483 RepID=A0A0F7SNK4_PHARH|nr:Predicted ATPase [Phaffia rhodozyma]